MYESFAKVHYYFAKNQQNSRLTVEICNLLVVDIFKCLIFFHKNVVISPKIGKNPN